MSPKDDKNVRYKDDVYETDSERSVANKVGPQVPKHADPNKALLFNVLDSKGYALGKVLGKGSFAVVHGAKEKSASVECAIKIVDCSKAPEDFITHFFPRELKIIRELQHENIISVSDVIKVW